MLTKMDDFDLAFCGDWFMPKTDEQLDELLEDDERNMLVPRKCPAELADRVTHLDTQSDELLERDLAFFYSAFVVEEVR